MQQGCISKASHRGNKASGKGYFHCVHSQNILKTAQIQGLEHRPRGSRGRGAGEIRKVQGGFLRTWNIYQKLVNFAFCRLKIKNSMKRKQCH
jgi:hypothetical protein